MAVCTSSSNIFAFKISLEDWNQTAEGHFLSLPFATSAPNQSLMKMIQWRLDIYPKGESEREGTRYVDVYLVQEDLPHDLDIGQFQVEAAFRFPPKDCDWPISARSFMRFHSSVFDNSNQVGFDMAYEVGVVEDRAVDGILTLEFEMRTFKAPWTKFKYSRGSEEIVRNFLRVNPADGDVKLISEGREIPCHKFLLMTQSPVFKAMFEMNSMEKETNTVKILDSSPDVVEELVKYLYEGTFLGGAKSVELMFGLLNLAEKYQIGLLTDECLDVLIDIMDVDNVLKIYAVIDKLDPGSNVTDLIIDFMKNNIDVIVDKEDWAPFLSDYPSLMKDFVLNITQALKQAKNN